MSVLVTTFQLASTALTVTLKAHAGRLGATARRSCRWRCPARRSRPGTRICSFAKAPALTVMVGLVFAVFVPSVRSVAVTVRVPAVFERDLKVCVPATRAALAGSVGVGVARRDVDGVGRS